MTDINSDAYPRASLLLLAQDFYKLIPLNYLTFKSSPDSYQTAPIPLSWLRLHKLQDKTKRATVMNNESKYRTNFEKPNPTPPYNSQQHFIP